MALADRKPRNAKTKVGAERPRLSPPVPARSDVEKFKATATELGISLLPWQAWSGRYIYALGPENRWLFPEIINVVSRQNGKTEILVPHIVTRLRMGRRITHTAQNRELPRHVFNRVATVIEAHHPDAKVRRGAGQETIEMGDALYRIVAPSRAGARGGSSDDLIIDEVREFNDMEFMSAAEPTLTASLNPQTLYLSNAGEEDSLVLNTLRLRASEDPALAYLEWSAAPERPSDDRDGWYEANPALGHFPGMLAYLERVHRSHSLAGTLAIFETEHLCRWVKTTRELLVDEFAWTSCRAPIGKPSRPYLGISMDPEGTRASVVMAWRQADDTIALQVLFNVPGNPIDAAKLGPDIAKAAQQHGVIGVAFDPLTDAALARYIKLPKPEPVSGGKFANASAQFVNAISAQRLRWSDAAPVSDDLTWTSKKHDRESGSYEAVRSVDNRPITAALAAIRAVWLAASPPTPRPRIY